LEIRLLQSKEKKSGGQVNTVAPDDQLESEVEKMYL